MKNRALQPGFLLSSCGRRLVRSGDLFDLLHFRNEMRSRFWMPCFSVAVDDGQPAQAPFMCRKTVPFW